MGDPLHRQVSLWVVLILLCLVGVLAFVVRGGETVARYDVRVENRETGTELAYGVLPALADRDYFMEVREAFLLERASFVAVDLTLMRLSVFVEGLPRLEVPIKSKGKEGSWWETPAGLYKAGPKKETHFSSFGHVYTPWNIPFQGNFFIHGWPYYTDGTPVAPSYSGGCIRLLDEYAEQVYELVEEGMPILVYESDRRDAAHTYTLASPDVTAASYLAADIDSGYALLRSGEDETYESTLVTKLLAALVVSEFSNIETHVLVPVSEVTEYDPYLKAGGTYSYYDLLHPLILAGSDGALATVAHSYGSARFETLLTQKMSSIGMRATRSSQGYVSETTAKDVFALLEYLEHNRPFILSLGQERVRNLAYSSSIASVVESTHPFKDDPSFVGGIAEARTAISSGQTAAAVLSFASTTAVRERGHEDLFTVFEVNFGDTTRTIAIVVLDSQNAHEDTRVLRQHIELLYR